MRLEYVQAVRFEVPHNAVEMIVLEQSDRL